MSLTTLFEFAAVIAVSYTHLDVYKRQVPKPHKCLFLMFDSKLLA